MGLIKGIFTISSFLYEKNLLVVTHYIGDRIRVFIFVEPIPVVVDVCFSYSFIVSDAYDKPFFYTWVCVGVLCVCAAFEGRDLYYCSTSP